jgi:hypothetical protein
MSDIYGGAELVCDVDECGHVEAIDELTADLIDKPCPICGANLLTADDYAAGKVLRATLASFQTLGLIKIGEPTGAKSSVSLNPHAGSIKIKLLNGEAEP